MAIRMEMDEEGFYRPHIDTARCIGCRACVRSCVALKDYAKNRDLRLFAAKNLCGADRKVSSSGGIFSALAKQVLREGGAVIGAACDELGKVYHTVADDERSLEELYGSKYVQSDFSNVYCQIESLLKEQRPILVCGTPCQIRAVRERFGDDEKLILVDFLCHGVASPMVFRQYLGARLKGQPAKRISFRDKTISAKAYAVHFESEDIRYKRYHRDDLFMRGYLDNVFLRTSCYQCDFSFTAADITLGDFFELPAIAADLEDGKGVSKVICASARGMAYLEKIRNEVQVIELGMTVPHKRGEITTKKRETFFQTLKSRSVVSALRRCVTPTKLKIWVYRKWKYRIK
jgi:coenzyme F420-reducing hydrogenase beta subunit